MTENYDGESPDNYENRADSTRSQRKRSRPVVKQSASNKLKKNKLALSLVILVIIVVVIATVYVLINNKSSSNNQNIDSYQSDPAFISAVANSDYPIAVLNTSKGIIAIELYNDEMPITCENFIRLVDDGFYNGIIFHRISDDFMIQAGNTYPDGSTKVSPYSNIAFENSDVKHIDGAISMASTGVKVGGSSQFFICDKVQSFLDGNYAAFGKTIYGIEVVRDIADEPQDGSSSAGGGKPYTDILINSIIIINE